MVNNRGAGSPKQGFDNPVGSPYSLAREETAQDINPYGTSNDALGNTEEAISPYGMTGASRANRPPEGATASGPGKYNVFATVSQQRYSF